LSFARANVALSRCSRRGLPSHFLRNSHFGPHGRIYSSLANERHRAGVREARPGGRAARQGLRRRVLRAGRMEARSRGVETAAPRGHLAGVGADRPARTDPGPRRRNAPAAARLPDAAPPGALDARPYARPDAAPAPRVT